MRPSLPAVLLLLAAAGASAAQDAASPAPVASDPAGTAPAEPSRAETDPLAAWEADPLRPLDAAGLDLAAFEFAARPLVVFADTPRDPRYEEQLRLLAADPGALAERDVAVILDADPAAASPARRALRPRGFGLVLLDKDGRVALRQPSPTAVRELARAIDRSALRREELRLGAEREGS